MFFLEARKNRVFFLYDGQLSERLKKALFLLALFALFLPRHFFFIFLVRLLFNESPSTAPFAALPALFRPHVALSLGESSSCVRAGLSSSSRSRSSASERKTQSRQRARAMSTLAAAAAVAAVAPSPLLRRAPAVARAPRRAGALPRVSPATAPALRGLKVRPQRDEKREAFDRESFCSFFWH